MKSERNQLRSTLRKHFPRDHSQLLSALHLLQEQFGYLPDWGMEVVGWHLGIPASEVYGAATSYTELRLVEPGGHVLKVCTGLSCRLNGADELFAKAARESGLVPNRVTPDERVVLEEVPCAFLCGMAPAIQWDGDWLGRVTVDDIKKHIESVTT